MVEEGEEMEEMEEGDVGEEVEEGEVGRRDYVWGESNREWQETGSL